MNKFSDQKLEDDFQERDELLLDLYDTKSDSMSDSEKESLLPILNSLQSNEQRYVEAEVIAEGGEKLITRVHDQRLNRQVAMAQAVHAKTREEQEEFLREACLEANLAHPNIVPIHNIGIDSEGTPFFTMELIHGNNLKEILAYLKQNEASYLRRYPLDELLNIYLKVCDAVAYAHSRHVLHLDIKPANIRIGTFGEVFLCDWGLSKILFSTESSSSDDSEEIDGDILNDLTLSGTVKGTPGFMAPEQMTRDGEKTIATDVYAMGALLYNLLTLQKPTPGSTLKEICKNTRAGTFRPAPKRCPYGTVPQNLVAVALKAMSSEPSHRYPDVPSIHKEISRYLAGFPTEAEQASPLTALALLVRRHNRMTLLILFFLIFTAGLISTALVVVHQGRTEAIAARELARSAQQTAENNLTLYREQQEKSFQLHEELTSSLLYTASSRDYKVPEEMIRLLNLGLKKELKPYERRMLLIQKGNLLYLLQRFNQASECFTEANAESDQSDEITSICRTYAVIKPDDDLPLSTQQLIQLLNSSRLRNPLLPYIYYHHMRNNPAPPPEEYLPLAIAMLDILNNAKAKLSPPSFTKGRHGYRLDLSRRRYSQYRIEGLNILKPLTLEFLDISKTPLKKLGDLNGLTVEELVLKKITLDRYNLLTQQLNTLGVKRISMDTATLPEHILKKLKQEFVLTETDQKTPTSP